ncbi:MAG: signal peptidase I [Sphingomonas sp.]|uniref:signal peptidase I n=1 Tax=Sphingomonas sp. TaxID=28214 RepID=UPI00185E79E9|nr:signal peptidase I [Sphingomonas sp.]MBA3668137.1 signal peptidase I [Sphingomonas sp.]
MALPFPFARHRYSAPASEKVKETPGGFLKSLLYLAVAAWILRSLIVAPFSIPSGSMLPTMMIGDYLFVSKWPYGYSSASFPFHVPAFNGRILGSTPNRGDVVVFVGPEGADVVKRVIGLPGDLIAVDAGHVILNGKPVPRGRIEDFAMSVSPNSPCRVVPPAVAQIRSRLDGAQSCLFPAYRETLPGGRPYVVLDQVDNSFADNFGPVVVPQGRLFLMGDNRDDSLDSRYPVEAGGMGFVPIDHVVGRAELAFWSTDGSASWVNPVSWFTALRTPRLGTDYHP